MKRTSDDIPQRVEKINGVTHIILEPGEMVFCDDCGEDFTDSPVEGGMLFGSKALCPTCTPKWEKGAKEYGEEHFIRARCPAGKTYANWVRQDLRK